MALGSALRNYRSTRSLSLFIITSISIMNREMRSLPPPPRARGDENCEDADDDAPSALVVALLVPLLVPSSGVLHETNLTWGRCSLSASSSRARLKLPLLVLVVAVAKDNALQIDPQGESLFFLHPLPVSRVLPLLG